MKQVVLVFFLIVFSFVTNHIDAQIKPTCLSGNCINGFGKYRYADSIIYAGYWKDDVMENPNESTIVKEKMLIAFADICSRKYSGFQMVKLYDEEGQCAVDLDFTLYTNYSVTGTTTLKLIYQNYTYSCKSFFSGTLNPNTNSMYLTGQYFINKDVLPDGLSWVLGGFNLSIYSDNTRNGHYLIQGYTDNGKKIAVRD